MPKATRKPLVRPQCSRCRYMHAKDVACPRPGVWLAFWSERVNGRRR